MGTVADARKFKARMVPVGGDPRKYWEGLGEGTRGRKAATEAVLPGQPLLWATGAQSHQGPLGGSIEHTRRVIPLKGCPLPSLVEG